MMSKMFDVVEKSLKDGDEMQCAFPGRHEGARGYVVLSKEKMLFVEEDHLMRGASRVFFEIPLWAISSVYADDEDHFVASANDGDEYIIESIFSSEVKAQFEKLKAEGEQATVIPAIQ